MVDASVAERMTVEGNEGDGGTEGDEDEGEDHPTVLLANTNVVTARAPVVAAAAVELEKDKQIALMVAKIAALEKAAKDSAADAAQKALVDAPFDYKLPWWTEHADFKKEWKTIAFCTLNPKMNEDKFDSAPMARVRAMTKRYYNDLEKTGWYYPYEENGAYHKLPCEVLIKMFEFAIAKPYMLPWNPAGVQKKVHSVFVLF